MTEQDVANAPTHTEASTARPFTGSEPSRNERAGEMRPIALEDVLDDRTRDLIRRRRTGKTHRRGWLVRRALAAADVFGLMLAFGLAQFIVGGAQAGAPDRVASLYEIIVFFATIPVWIVFARLYGLYGRDEERADHSSVDDLFGVFNMISVGTWAFFVLTRLTGVADPSLAKLMLFWASAVVFVVVGRVLARAVCRRTNSYVQNTLIVGAGTVGQRVAEKLIQHPKYGVNVVGFVDEHPRTRLDTLEHLTVLGPTAQLSELVQRLYIERVIIAFSQEPHTATLETIRTLNALDVRVDVVPRLFEVLGPNVSLHAAEGLPLIGLPAARLSRSSVFLKRTMDISLSSALLVLLAPLFALVAGVIKLDSHGPVFFRQRRMGRGEYVFRIYKFRTMTSDADARKSDVAHLNKHLGRDTRMFKIRDDPRVTRLGRFLRRTSIDELPQLINVLRGEMSLVGPRPLILEEDQHVDGWARRRLDLKPGMTGLWQVLGRDDIPFEEMVGLDYRYVTSWSLSNDLKLLARTLPIVLYRDGA